MRGRAEPAEAPDPAAEEVAAAFEESRGRYGAGKIKASLARMGVVLGRRRIVRIMKGKGLVGAYAGAEFKPSRLSAGEAGVPNIVYGERFSTLRELQAKLSDYVNRHNSFRLHSTLGYMSPVEFRLAGLTL